MSILSLKTLSSQLLRAFAVRSYSTNNSASALLQMVTHPPENALVWMDFEMTGLNVKTDKIIEVSCLITDKDLNIIAEELDFAIKHPKEVFENMNEWCMKKHYESGLVQKCLDKGIKPDCAETLLLEFLEKHVPKGKCPLAGNSVYMDRIFLREYMPRVNNYLHYRIVDVSTIKELCNRWNPDVMNAAPKKRLCHRSLDDIKESINELKYYRDEFFKTQDIV